MKLFILFFIFFLNLLEGFNYYFLNFNLKIKKPIDSCIINFIKINDINYIRVKDNSKYLVLRYLHEPLEEKTYNYNISTDKYYYDIYDIIKYNTKPIIISYEKKKEDRSLNYKYSYLIKNSTSYLSKYTLNYNNLVYKYSFDINSNMIDKFETNWNIKAKYNTQTENNSTINYIKNWIEYNLNNNNKYYYYKKYLLFNYYYNNYII
jgi:hypothetical protein